MLQNLTYEKSTLVEQIQVMAWCRQATIHYLQKPILIQIYVPHMVSLGHNELTHWGRVTHICVVKLTTIGSDNGLSPGRRQDIIWTNAGILLIRTLGTNFSEILGEIHSFSFKKMRLKMSSAKWRLFGLGHKELIHRPNQIWLPWIDSWTNRHSLTNQSVNNISLLVTYWLIHQIFIFHKLLRDQFHRWWVSIGSVNTLRPRQDWRHFADDIFKCIFLNENVWIPIKISLKFVPKGPINNIPAVVQIMTWRRPGDKPLSEPMMVKLPTHICHSASMS